MPIVSKTDAQKRADQIKYFQDELKVIQQENIISLNEDQRSAITQYHENLIKQFTSDFDIDSSKQEKQLSLGMKITSFFGALAFAASIFFLFLHFWGRFSTNIQVIILMVTPLIGLASTLYISSKDKSGYFSLIFGLVTIAAFILNILMLGRIFNITPSENTFLLWSVFAFLLAYALNARFLLSIGIIFFASFLSMKTGTWSGYYWIGFGERPENFFSAAFLLFLIPFLPHSRFSDFSSIYRIFSMLLFFLPVLILSHWGYISYLNFENYLIESFYQVIGFVFSALAIFVGIKKSWPELVNTGSVFFTIFLYTKFYDWWWDWMPKYIFFLVIGLTAVLMLFIFKRLRSLLIKNVQELSE